VLVSVRDSGPGLNPESLERFFRPVLHDQAWRNGHGTIDLAVRSWKPTGDECGRRQNITQGATFHFSLPAYEVYRVVT